MVSRSSSPCLSRSPTSDTLTLGTAHMSMIFWVYHCYGISLGDRQLQGMHNPADTLRLSCLLDLHSLRHYSMESSPSRVVCTRLDQPLNTLMIQPHQRICYSMNTYSDLHRSDIRTQPRMLHKLQHRDWILASIPISQYASRFPRWDTYSRDTACTMPHQQQ